MNTDVEDLLRDGMERFTADLRAPAGLTCQIARRRRRRLVLRSMTGGIAMLAAGAAALAVLALPRVSGTGQQATDTAYVIRSVDNALSAAAPGTIAQMTVTSTTGAATTTAEEWSSSGQWRSVMYSSSGHPIYDEGQSGRSSTLVSYPANAWARQVGGYAPYAPLPRKQACRAFGLFAPFPVLFRPGLSGKGTSASSLPMNVAQAVRNAVSCGSLTVDGRQTINGTKTIKLTSSPGSRISETVWVNPRTYLPVRVTGRYAVNDSPVQQTADLTWLPPTAQNRAKLTVPIPAGFREVPLIAAIAPPSS